MLFRSQTLAAGDGAVGTALESARPGLSLREIAAIARREPAARDAAIEHRWGGSFAAPRDWSMQVGFDRRTGIAAAGGFAGHGLTGTSIAGRTLADLILDRESDLVTLPWVGHESRKWEPEPLRGIAARTISAVLLSADEAEARTGRPAKRVKLVQRFMPGR